jgi:hypothetical protein
MMKNGSGIIWRRISVLGAALFLGSCPLAAQDQPVPRLFSIDVSPQVGIRTSMDFNTDVGIEGAPGRVSFQSTPSFGVSAGIRYDDENVVEFRWARQNTNMRVTGAPIPFSPRVALDQFHLDCSHEYVVEGWPEWARPFVVGSVGVTHVSSTATTAGFTRFSFGIGGGVKAFPSPHIGFKMQAQWLPLWINPEVTAFCSLGCVLHLHGQLASQGEVTFGPVFRF